MSKKLGIGLLSLPWANQGMLMVNQEMLIANEDVLTAADTRPEEWRFRTCLGRPPG